MARVVDITDKLSFDENPVIRIKGEELEVQSGAENMLRILGLFDSEKTEVHAAVEAAELMFNDRDKKKIARMKLQIGDYMQLIKEAINVALDADDSQGEQ